MRGQIRPFHSTAQGKKLFSGRRQTNFLGGALPPATLAKALAQVYKLYHDPSYTSCLGGDFFVLFRPAHSFIFKRMNMKFLIHFKTEISPAGCSNLNFITDNN